MHTPEQKALLAIQQIDLDIAKLARAIDEHEAKQRIALIGKQIAQADAILEQLSAERATINSQYVDAKLEVESLQEKVTQDRARLGGGLGHREVGHLQREIDTMVRRIDALEYGEIAQLDKRDELDGKIEQLTAKRAEFEAAAEDLGERFRTLASHAQARTAQLGRQRALLGEQVPASVLERYEVAARRHGGVGVGLLEGDACSACQMVLAVTQADLLRSGGPVGSCPQCQRVILVPQPDSAGE